MHDTNLLEDQPIAWTPTPDVIERAQLTRFMRQVGVTTWDELYEFSIRDVEKFTEEVLRFLDIKFDPPYERLLDTLNGIEVPSGFATGFPRSRKDAKQEPGPEGVATGLHAGLNLTTMCLDRWLPEERSRIVEIIRLDQEGEEDAADEMESQTVPAIIWEDEAGRTVSLSYIELAKEV